MEKGNISKHSKHLIDKQVIQMESNWLITSFSFGRSFPIIHSFHNLINLSSIEFVFTEPCIYWVNENIAMGFK